MELAAEKQPHSNAFFLFLLGTDTLFQKTTSPDFPQGETLSFVAQYLAEQQLQHPGAAQAIAFQTDTVCVLNGPDTLGRAVGQRIAQSLIIVLQALNRPTPPKQLFLAAHSRGACQAKLLAHELQRLQSCIGPLIEEETLSLDLAKLVLTSPCPYTKAALSTHADTILTLTGGKHPSRALLHSLKTLELFAFLIDPVPGTMQANLRGYNSINWNDARFSKPVPSKDYELLVYANERSSMFYPAIPNDTHHLVIPGHHGTGSGNNKTQKKHVLNLQNSEEHLSLVQDLVLIKMLRFMKKHGLIVHKPLNPALQATHPHLSRLAEDEMQRSESLSNKNLLALYAKLRQHHGTYKKLEEHTYRFLASTGNTRFALHGGKHIALDPVTQDIRPEYCTISEENAHTHQYINIEEAFLDIQARLQAETPAQLLKAIQSLIEEAGSVGNPENQTTPLAASLPARKVRNYFMSLLGTAFDRISTCYLDGSMADPEKRAAFWACLATLKRQDSCRNHDFLCDLQTAVSSRIETAIQSKLANLAKQFEHNVQLDDRKLEQIQSDLQRLQDDIHAVSEVFSEISLNDALLQDAQTRLQSQKSAWEQEILSVQETERRGLEAYQNRQNKIHDDILNNRMVFQNPELARLNALCQHYREHLFKALQADELNALKGQLRQDFRPDDDRLIGQKIRYLYDMQSALHALQEKSAVQQEDLQEFEDTFKKAKSCFAKRRSGMLFVKRIAIVLGIIFSGIVPGLMCLGVFAYRSKTSVLRVKGQGFTENIDKNLNMRAQSA